MGKMKDVAIDKMNNKKERGQRFIKQCRTAIQTDEKLMMGTVEFRPIDCALVVGYYDILEGDVQDDFLLSEPENMLIRARRYALAQD